LAETQRILPLRGGVARLLAYEGFARPLAA
jgi:hypothetical protein